MSEINTNLSSTQNVAPKTQVAPKKEEAPKEDKKGIGKKVALISGSAAIAATVIGGILYKKSANTKALTKEIESFKKMLNGSVESQRPCEEFCEIFNPEILQGHIDDAAKLPKKEQLARLKEMSSILYSDRGFETGLTHNIPSLKIDRAALPKEVQDAIATKDQLKATEAYINYCDNLFHKSKTAGSTIQESVTNVFGKETSVKPHTYDLTKEADRIATVQYGADGYCNITVTSENTIADKRNWKNIIQLDSSMKSPSLEENALIVSEMRDGKQVVTISYKSGNREDALNAIELISPNAELTPAQKDLLKLKDKAAGMDIADLQKATMPTDGSYGQTNFDAILSCIQTMASKV
ncbi:MAG: hypothetical protein NC200_02840 [Candidatus Gastranaerophilales bacterium]|nr:hypothetical protein [Candidatus Gastranaerophilales bacterium]